MATIKAEYYRLNGAVWDKYYFKTTADMVEGLNGLNVVDVRELAGGSSTFNLTPNGIEDKTIKPYFAQLSGAGSSWRSLINVKGWTGSYANWQLIGPGGTSADDDLYFRSGAGASWRTPRKIFHSGNLTAATASSSGLLSTGTQTISGEKTFSSPTTFSYNTGHMLKFGSSQGQVYVRTSSGKLVIQNNDMSTYNPIATENWVTANSRSNTWTPSWSQVSGKPTNIIRQVSFSNGNMTIEVI